MRVTETKVTYAGQAMPMLGINKARKGERSEHVLISIICVLLVSIALLENEPKLLIGGRKEAQLQATQAEAFSDRNESTRGGRGPFQPISSLGSS